jgi:peptide-methionine (S)-S-oxide reductase
MTNYELATVGGGCFWCTEAVFELAKGVEKVLSGYAGGHVANPTYEAVCGKKTGHAEVIQITFDPAVITYREILSIFFGTHDPTTPNRQGNDVGPQYRSVIFFHSPEQERTARDLIAELDRDAIFPGPIVTEVAPLPEFYPAEDYHQGYYRQNPMQPYCAFVTAPKVAKFREKFTHLRKG